VISPTARLDKIPGIGPATTEKLLSLGLLTVLDLLRILPRAWDDLTQLHQIQDLQPNGQKYTIKATLENPKMFRTSRRRMVLTQATAHDDTGSVDITWFNQPYLVKNLKTETGYYLTGVLVQGKRGLMFSNPSVEIAEKTPIHSGRIVPTYSSIGGLTTKILRRIFLRLIPNLDTIVDPLPSKLVKKWGLLDLDSAIRQLHLPTNTAKLEAAKERLAFDELLGVQLQVQAGKNFLSTSKAKPIPTDLAFIKQVIRELPFTLTNGQKRAIWDLLQDNDKPVPTNRLIEGDVGSGKTIVATLAMFNAARFDFQSALMVPTEVLAHQHYENLKPLADQFNLTISLQTQSKTIGDTSADIVIGTHKLIHKTVEFNNLNLVVVDEQHRFGVKQREALKLAGSNQQKHIYPHFVSLTATPIPRSLALTLFGDLDLSIIPQPPAHRLPIISQAISNSHRKAAYDQIKAQLEMGHQAFIVTPLIETSLKLNAKSVEKEADAIRNLFPNHRVGVLHGRLDSNTKASVMEQFKNQELDILVTTTVIEVGIDVPNATVMLIEGAERFGLSQLHQLRGRVGRSNHQSYCFVIPTEEDIDIMERLELFATTTDGFKLAELDLELRGPGSLTGISQAGFVKFRLADWSDPARIEFAQSAAKELLHLSPTLEDYPQLMEQLNIATPNYHAE